MIITTGHGSGMRVAFGFVAMVLNLVVSIKAHKL